MTRRHHKAEEDNTHHRHHQQTEHGLGKNTSKNDEAQEELRQSAMKPTPSGGAIRREGLRSTVAVVVFYNNKHF